MKNILFLEQYAEIAGGQQVLLDIIDGLDRNVYTPFVALPAEGALSRELKKRDVKYFVLPIGSYSAGKKSVLDIFSYFWRSIFLVPKTKRLIKDFNINLVYANAPRTFYWGTRAARELKVAIIWHPHIFLGKKELAFCLKLFKSYGSRIVADSKAIADQWALLSSKVETVYNGVDPERFKKLPVIRQQLGVPTDKTVFGFIGRISRMKGIEDFIEAADEACRVNKDIYCLVAGKALFGEGKYKEKLISLVKKLGLENYFKFIGRRENLLELLGSIDVLVVPSIEPESFSLIAVEAMAAGKPVIASEHGGPAEIIRDQIDGLLYPPGDHKRLADSIIKLASDTGKLKAMGQAGQQRVLENFSVSRFQKRINDVIKTVLKE